MFLSPRMTWTKCSTLTDDFNKQWLHAKSNAALEEHTCNSKSLTEDATSQVFAHRQRFVLTIWHLMASRRKTEHCANAEKATRNEKKLTLSIAIQSWRSDVKISQKKCKLNLMIESKWEQWGLCHSRIRWVFFLWPMLSFRMNHMIPEKGLSHGVVLWMLPRNHFT